MLLKHLRKSVSLLMLLAYMIVLLTPMVALAEDDDDDDGGDTDSGTEESQTLDVTSPFEGFLCEFEGGYEAQEVGKDDETDEAAAEYIEYYEFMYITSLDEQYCGDINPFTGLYEKGDCSLEGKVITEINETFGGSPDAIDGNEVVTLYKGSCCFAYKTNSKGEVSECEDIRYVYTDSFETCSDQAIECERKQWIIGSSGVGIVKIFVKMIYIWGAGIAGFIAVAVITISGVQISVSGISGDISSAKTRIMQSISGLVLIFLSGLLLYAVNPTFFS